MAGPAPAMLRYAASTEQRHQVRLLLLDLIALALARRLPGRQRRLRVPWIGKARQNPSVSSELKAKVRSPSMTRPSID